MGGHHAHHCGYCRVRWRSGVDRGAAAGRQHHRRLSGLRRRVLISYIILHARSCANATENIAVRWPTFLCSVLVRSWTRYREPIWTTQFHTFERTAFALRVWRRTGCDPERRWPPLLHIRGRLCGGRDPQPDIEQIRWGEAQTATRMPHRRAHQHGCPEMSRGTCSSVSTYMECELPRLWTDFLVRFHEGADTFLCAMHPQFLIITFVIGAVLYHLTNKRCPHLPLRACCFADCSWRCLAPIGSLSHSANGSCDMRSDL